jgi:dihydroxyacid dehydratase/phosphogluconate dehydratase
MVFRRLIRSLPTRRGVLGIASCDKGLTALVMALVAQHDTPTILVPGGVTLRARHGEETGTIQTIGVRFTTGELSLDEAAELGCRACASAGGGCQFLGTAGTAQVVGEALGIALPHSALCRPASRCGPTWRRRRPGRSSGSRTPGSRRATSSPTTRSRTRW